MLKALYGQNLSLYRRARQHYQFSHYIRKVGALVELQTTLQNSTCGLMLPSISKESSPVAEILKAQ